MLVAETLAKTSPDIAIAAAPYPKLRSALWLMGLLIISATLYNIDRLIVSVLAEQIRGDLHVSEVQLGLLIGLAYSVLSAIFAVFLGFWADRSSRTRVLSICLTVWSLATIGGGLSATFGWLFLARSLVGLGEAALAPAAMSLIADIFPPGKRARALGIYSLGATLGTALSTVIPGLIVGANLRLTAPIIGSLAPWRTTFVLCGLSGLFIAACLLTTREPVRQGPLAAVKSRARAGFAANLSYLGRHFSVLGPFLFGIGVFYLALLAVTSWTTVFISRHFGLPLNRFSAILGLTLLIAGACGYLAGGVVVDTRFFRTSVRKLGFMAALPILALPSAFVVFAPNLPVALMMLGAISFTAPVIIVANGAMLQDLLPNDMRGFGSGLCTVMTSLLGMGGGPLLVAAATQHLFKRPDMVGYSILIVTVPALLISVLSYSLARMGVRRHLILGSPVVDVMRAADAI